MTTPNDLGQVVWGCIGTTISGADGTAIGTGNQNTVDIVADCSETGIAAKLCSDLSSGGYDDWYLPSKDELNQIWTRATVLEANGDDFVANVGYWGSTELSSDLAWSQEVSNSAWSGKTDSRPVRAVRAF